MEASLAGDLVTLRPLVPGDRDRLRDILAEPEVFRWWGAGGVDHAADGLFDPEEVVFAIEVEGAVVGAIQYAEENEPDYRHASIDLFIDTAHQGLGIGPDAIRTLARHLFEERGHHRLTIDPAAANVRAIRAYRRVGFQPVGIMRNYERGPDGTWHDGLLLDMLRDDLVESSAAPPQGRQERS